MEEIIVPPIGTRVEVMSRYSIPWMNEYRQPTVGIVAHSNTWDQPGTFRLVRLEGMLAKNHDSVISVDHVEYLKVLGTSREPSNPEAASAPDPKSAATFEIKGSKGDVYLVTLDDEKSSCTCIAGKHGKACKHVKAAREMQSAD